jgi:hypothetical protein
VLTREWTVDGHIDRVIITTTPAGWEVRTERDGTVVKRRTYADWHQVERAVRWFDLFDGGTHIRPERAGQ